MSDPVWEDIVAGIDDLVMDAVESDTADLATVIKVHDKLIELTETVSETRYSGMGQIAQKAAELAMKVVLQEADDPEHTLDIVIESTSCLQCMGREILKGSNPSYIPIPEGLELDSEELFQDNDEAEEAPAPAPAPAIEPEPEEEPITEDIEQSPGPKPHYPKFDMGTLTPSHLSDFLNEMYDLVDKAEGLLLALEKTPTQSQDSIHELLGVYHTIKGISGIMRLQEIIDLAHEAEILLEDVQHVTPQAIDLLFKAIDVFKLYTKSLQSFQDHQTFEEVPPTSNLIEELRQIDLSAVEPPKPKPAPVKQPEPEPKPKPVIEKQLASKPKSTIVETPAFKKDPQTQSQELDFAEKSDSAYQQQQDTLKIATKRLDSLIDTVGELVIAQAMLEHDPEISAIEKAQTVRNLSTVSKITRELQELSMSMRMVTIQPTFQAMERVVRDLASAQQKEIDVTVVGGQTELDRNVIDAMYNPLIHLIRNAVDHGIEGKEARKAKGKDAKAQIVLSAYHRGGNIIVEIQDDGRGLQKEKIRNKAVEKGLIVPEQHFADEAIFQTIFAPGFSTAEVVTDVSGRGVGLDVVKKELEKFRGHVEVSSEEGKGTTFRLTLPLTLAIIDGMLVKVGGQRYIVPLSHIEEFVQISADDVSTITGEGEILKLRGMTMPMFHLQRILNVRGEVEEKTDKTVGVIVAWEGRRCCFVVQELINQQQVVIKTLGEDFEGLVGISGAAILGDGRVGLILDIQNIFQQTIAK